MIREIDRFYQKYQEPARSCMQALRSVILRFDGQLTEAWKYGMPFYYFQNKRVCYLWMDKKTGQPYIGIVDGYQINHPLLESGNRSQIKIMRIDPEADIPVETIHIILQMALALCQKTNFT